MAPNIQGSLRPPSIQFVVPRGALSKFKVGGKQMRYARSLVSQLSLVLIGLVAVILVQAAPAQQGPVTVPLQRVGNSSFASAPMATDVSGVPDEIDAAVNGGDADGNSDNGSPT